MASWVNIKASESLLAELNAAFPNRDKKSDGTIGDTRHSQESSDHNPDETGHTPFHDADSINEVHARDIDSDLNRPGWTLERVLEIIRKRCATGQEKRVQNIISNGKIASRSWGFSWRAYGGADPHDTHGHVSFVYGSGDTTANPENITAPWGILAAVQAEEHAKLAPNPDAAALLTADNIIPNRKWCSDIETNPYISMRSVLTLTADQAHEALVQITAARIAQATALSRLGDLWCDPASLPDPEKHPLVKAVRYVIANPIPPMSPPPTAPSIAHLPG